MHESLSETRGKQKNLLENQLRRSEQSQELREETDKPRQKCEKCT
jgi:hypothetical protein